MRALIACLALAAFATTASAQGSVKDQSRWVDNKGTVVTVQVSPRTDGKVDVTFISANGFTSAVTGVKGPGPGITTTSSPAATTTGGTDTFKVRDPVGLLPCAVCIESGGKWVPMKPVRTKTHRKPRFRVTAAGGLDMGGPEEGGSMPDPFQPKPL